ncbi:hypothetical protein ILYODFUR_007506, partial [Ilyodon furcidens]
KSFLLVQLLEAQKAVCGETHFISLSIHRQQVGVDLNLHGANPSSLLLNGHFSGNLKSLKAAPLHNLLHAGF